MIRCMAIDDEPLALQQITAYIGKVPFLELAAQCQSALEAHRFLQNDTVDVIFCDINMPDLNGMDFIKTLTAPPLVVFTTAYAEYAVEGFKVNAVDYLLKPFGLQDFMRAANRIQERLAPNAPPASQSTNAGSAEDDTIFLNEPKPIITLLSMKKMEERLPDTFMRIHRSYIINLTKIQEVNKNRVIMDADTYLPIGEMYKDTFQNYLNTKFLGK